MPERNRTPSLRAALRSTPVPAPPADERLTEVLRNQATLLTHMQQQLQEQDRLLFRLEAQLHEQQARADALRRRADALETALRLLEQRTLPRN